MLERIASVFPEFFTRHYQQKPELRLENELKTFLDREQLADDRKMKLLSLPLTISKNAIYEPSEPIRVSDVDENEQPKIVEDKILENVKADAKMDPILKDIVTSLHSSVKFIPSIVEKQRNRGHSWNKYGEMTHDNLTKDSSIVDFFHIF
ncbi:uncharacterized protein NPIL_222331 [Nephila pilipes]|uniref:Uncharacterized protein n=1 Tax=Nephila pilipes TaxID=299642 RepID=A0A8X6PAM8_NEPPI|nr:uncharacterized protein NPIL_222331 [Nephila pilipes]